MVVTAGQQDRRHLIQDPMLGGDLLALAQGAFKDAVEVTRVEDLPTLMRRAFLLAADGADRPGDGLHPGRRPRGGARRRCRRARGSGGSARPREPRISPRHCSAAGAPAIVAGDGVGREGAVEELVASPRRWAPPSSTSPCTTAWTSRRRILFGRDAPAVDAAIREPAGGPRRGLPGWEPRLLGPLLHRRPSRSPTTRPSSSTPTARAGPQLPRAIALQGGIRATLQDLAARLVGGVPDAEARLNAARARREAERANRDGAGARGSDAAAVARALTAALPDDTSSSRRASRPASTCAASSRLRGPGCFTTASAARWAGARRRHRREAGAPRGPVVAAVGDGCAMFGIQGLWSAARYEVPLVIVVLNNREYRACKRGIDRVVSGGGESYVGMDSTDPEIDFIGLARSLGVEARSAAAPRSSQRPSQRRSRRVPRP